MDSAHSVACDLHDPKSPNKNGIPICPHVAMTGSYAAPIAQPAIAAKQAIALSGMNLSMAEQSAVKASPLSSSGLAVLQRSGEVLSRRINFDSSGCSRVPCLLM